MNSVVGAHISEQSPESYIVSMFQQNVRLEFKTLDKAIDYAKKHILVLLQTSEIVAVSIHYERNDKRASYIIFEKFEGESGEVDIIEYEQTAFDYVTTHPYMFKKKIANRMINETYYSFHDFARVKVLTTNKMIRARLSLNIIAMIMGFILFFYGMHSTTLSSESSIFSSLEKSWLSFSITLTSLFTMGISALAIAVYLIPYKKAKDGYLDEVDWRKLNNKRNNLRTISGILYIICFLLFIHIFIVFGANNLLVDIFKNELSSFSIALIFNFILITIIFILAISNTIVNILFYKKNIHKYFNDQEINNYKLWIKNKNVEVVYKTDHNYFVLPYEQTYYLSARKKEMFKEELKSLTNDELKEDSIRLRKNYTYALQEYLNTEMHKEIEREYNGHILQNN